LTALLFAHTRNPLFLKERIIMNMNVNFSDSAYRLRGDLESVSKNATELKNAGILNRAIDAKENSVKNMGWTEIR
jgi:hypothetical protein